MSRSRRKTLSSIETLESRIAPALLIVGANLLGAPGGPTTGSTSLGGHSVTVIQVLSGEAIVWWDGNNIDAVSFGPNARLDITGNVIGDIIGNLTASGQLSNTAASPINGQDGNVLLPNNLLGLTTHVLGSQKGDVDHIITGGSVSNVNIAGELNGIYAGDGAFFPGKGMANPASELLSNGFATSYLNVNINPLAPGGEYSFNFTQATSKTLEPSASITNVTVATAGRMQVFAGSGNPDGLTTLHAGVSGGSISDLSIQTGVLIRNGTGVLPSGSVYSYYLLAGDGSSGLVGGAGGSISNITEVTSAGEVIIQAGQGGNGSHGAGGVGGSITSLNLQSDSTQYFVNAGNGGVGTPGGAGGKLTDNNFANRSATGGILVPGNFTGPVSTNPNMPGGSGADDLMVIDQGTGNMILEENMGGTGTDFVPVVQYTPMSTGEPVTIIPSEGTTPIAAAAVYLEGPDAPLDLVVAYQSGELVAFINQGNGVFYSKSLGTSGGFPTSTLSLPFTPSHMAVLDQFGDAIVLSANVAGTLPTTTSSGTPTTSDLYLAAPAPSTSGGLPSFEIAAGFDVVPATITALQSTGNDTFFSGTAQGAIQYYTIGGFNNPVPLTPKTSAMAHVNGGISELALDSTGQVLVAVSTESSTVAAFNFNLANPIELAPLATVTGFQGKPISADFIQQATGTPDSLAILSQYKSDSAITLLLPQASATGGTVPSGYTVSQTLNFNETVNEVVPVYPNPTESTAVSLADLTNAVNKFEVSTAFATPVDYPLPFASKSVIASAGNGGDGVDYTSAHGSLVVGAGGAGGSIYGINIQAHVIALTAGSGGDTETGAGGAGGSIGDPTQFTSGGASVTPVLISDDVLGVNVGDGGSPSDPGPKASGGDGGSINGLAVTLNSGNMSFEAGIGGDSMGGNAGNGGIITGLMATNGDGNIAAVGGNGGDALAPTGAGGAGGAIVGLHYQLLLPPSVAVLEKPYAVTLTAGIGGDSIGGAGGTGGAITGANLNVNPSWTTDGETNGEMIIDAGVDNTTQVVLTAGHGGTGAAGGNGGAIQGLNFVAYYDHVGVGMNTYVLDPVALSLTAGYGGAGTKGNGGNGGGVSLSTPIQGVSYIDNGPANPSLYPYASPADTEPNQPSATNLPLVVTAGHGGDGSVKGGAGGSISGIVSENSQVSNGDNLAYEELYGAALTAGYGGNGGTSNGGVGGSITGSSIGFQNAMLEVTAGQGGNGGTATSGALPTATGGAGGSINSSVFGLVDTADAVGIDIAAGGGGNGIAAGGAGGSVAGMTLNTSEGTQIPPLYLPPVPSAIIYAGAGGAADSASGAGGHGGSISGITQTKDINSSIDVLQAGNGGDNALGKGGSGGNVSGIHSVGFIGRPLDDNLQPLGVFDFIGSEQIAQGIFSGRGGTGASTALDGTSGFVENVVARQIAAISAAEDPSTGLFAAASKIANITAEVIGYDGYRESGSPDAGVYTDNNGNHNTTPGTAIPYDGFMWSISPATGIHVEFPEPTFVFVGA